MGECRGSVLECASPLALSLTPFACGGGIHIEATPHVGRRRERQKTAALQDLRLAHVQCEIHFEESRKPPGMCIERTRISRSNMDWGAARQRPGVRESSRALAHARRVRRGASPGFL